jgi:adenosylmethionine---8-amino-7-oxononanoate aminotransferase
VWLRPFGRLIYTMPPYIIQPQELRSITQAIYRVVSEIGGGTQVGSELRIKN